MRVAVVGGGTAAYLAAAHLTAACPEVELVQIRDPRAPGSGVGEGTTPLLRTWLENTVGVDARAVEQELHAVEKRGVRFEGWGSGGSPFEHDFLPASRASWHLSAERLPGLLERFIDAERVDATAASIEDRGDRVVVGLSGGDDLVADLVLDARGFPRVLTAEHEPLPWIVTQSAIVVRGPARQGETYTRAIARHHGWVFAIPLRHDTAYGYVYSSAHCTDAAAGADLTDLLASEGTSELTERRTLRFPNFVQRSVFHGRVLHLGNSAAFVEPLEATSITLTLRALDALRVWLQLFRSSPTASDAAIRAISADFRTLVLESSLFIAWHYSAGSRYDTAFWSAARDAFTDGLERRVPAEVRERFERHVGYGRKIPPSVLRAVRRGDAPVPEPPTGYDAPFGGMSPLGFAQIEHGLRGRG